MAMNHPGFGKPIPNDVQTREKPKEDEKEADAGEMASKNLEFVHRIFYCKSLANSTVFKDQHWYFLVHNQ